MKKLLLLIALLGAIGADCAPSGKRDIAVVRNYIVKHVGDKVISEIKRKKGGEAFLKKFFADQEWMEQFAGSGPAGGNSMGGGQKDFDYGDSLKALDLLVWNDKNDFISTPTGRNIANSLALNHGHDVYGAGGKFWDEEKLVGYMEAYREWVNDGTLHDTALELDTWGWREVTCTGQNANISVRGLRWIHNYATLPAPRYGGVCWTCSYRLWNCFGASVHGPQYYQPWVHRWNEQELRYRVGAVCGGLSKFGSHCAEAHGVRSYTAGQPGHCAFMLWDFDNDRWGISYGVTSHTGAHFSLGTGNNFTANEEQARYYRSPKRREAEYLMWKGDYASAMKLVKGNWSAAKLWQEELKKSPTKEGWAQYAECVRETFKHAPSEGWDLYNAYVDSLPHDKEQLAAVKQGLLTFTEFPAQSTEPFYFEEKVLDPLAKRFNNDVDTLWKLFPSMLDGQGDSTNFYPKVINWASGKLMKNPQDSKRFLKAVGANAMKFNRELDYKGMIVTATEANDIEMFKQVYKLLDKLSPKLAVKTVGKDFPLVAYDGAQLLSKDGLLRTSSTCGYDIPLARRNVIDEHDFGGQNGFHTDKEEEPWAQVQLPGDCEIEGLMIQNLATGYNGMRQVPLEISISKDGVEFSKVKTLTQLEKEWNIKFDTPLTAKFIRLTRLKGDRKDKEYFHLKKILVYGTKLY